MKKDPVSGVLTREELAAAVAAPYGYAVKIIRKHDPMWGRSEGEKIRWKVTAREVMTGTAIVEAATEDEANELADKLEDSNFEWESYGPLDGVTIEKVEIEE